MPWEESCAVDQRMKFIVEWSSKEWSVVELCERRGVSRKTAYKWIGRYRAEGPCGLAHRSSAPLVHGRATAPDLAAEIVKRKLERPTWGPRKIIGKLAELYPRREWPAPSTAGEILRRAGLTQLRRPRRRAPPTLGGLTEPDRPNHVWATDHKGWVTLGDGSRCEPLTLTDGYSRFLIGLHPCRGTREAEARPVFERAFANHGLPEVIRSDNGTPFASEGVTGLTALTVWWAKLGIRHERIAPGRPQQNGRHERFHLTLKEAMQPKAADLADQAARFEAFLHDYNVERPHEALGQAPPARHYVPSPRAMPERLPEPDYPAAADIRRVRSNGCIKWGGGLVYVSSALVGELVAMQETPNDQWVMRFYDISIGVLDPRQKRLRRLTGPARGAGQATPNLSPMYPV
jgi:transposase InsO family protein